MSRSGRPQHRTMMFPRTAFGLLAGLALAGVVAWQLGGLEGTGAILGYLLGAALVSFGTAWQAHWLRVRPARVLHAQIEAFLAKLGTLLVAALAFRFVPSLGEVADWRSFVVAFALAVAVGLPLGSWETARRLRSQSTTGAAALGERSPS